MKQQEVIADLKEKLDNHPEVYQNIALAQHKEDNE